MADNNKGIADDEADHVASHEAGEWKSVGNIDERRAFWAESASAHINPRRQRISLAVPEHDLRKLKARAVAEGIPYQTLINSLIHKYVEGTLK